MNPSCETCIRRSSKASDSSTALINICPGAPDSVRVGHCHQDSERTYLEFRLKQIQYEKSTIASSEEAIRERLQALVGQDCLEEHNERKKIQ